MKNLFEDATHAELQQRIDRLDPSSGAQWGKMNAAQALAHCVIAMEMAVGDRHPERLLIGRLLGPIFRRKALDETPLAKNSPTDPTFVVAGTRDLDVERRRLKAIVQRFHEGGPTACTTTPHSFFGTFTPAEWARQQYKHLDHHLRQFSA